MGPKLKTKLHQIQKNWEKYLFWVMLLLATVLFFSFLFDLVFADPPPPELNITGSSQKTIFGENAFAFLYGVPVMDEDESPFNFQKSFPKPKQRTWHKPKDNKKPPPKPKPKPKEGHVIHYTGWITVASGEKVAFVKVMDFRSQKLLKSDTVKVGASIKGYTIKSIGDEKIEIETDDGTEKIVPIHKQITIMK